MYRIGDSGFNLSSLFRVLDPGNILGQQASAAPTGPTPRQVAADQAAQAATALATSQLQGAQNQLTQNAQDAKRAADEAAQKLLTAQQYAQFKQQILQTQYQTQSQLQAAQAQAQIQQMQMQMQMQAAQAQQALEREHYKESLRRAQEDAQAAADQAAYYAQYAGYADPSQGYAAPTGAIGQWGHIPGDDDRGAQYGVQLSGCW